MVQQKFLIYRLRFTSPLHFSDEKNDDYSNSQRTIHSDTLHAALVSALAKTGLRIPEGGDLGFAISSLFPYYQQGMETKPVYFLPRPTSLFSLPNELFGYHKNLKALRWVDLDFFARLIHGEKLFNDSEVLKSIQGEYLSVNALPKNGFVHATVVQRVQIPRICQNDDQAEQSRPFYMERVYFGGASGLWFLVHPESKHVDLLDKGLKILENEGLGTDRNIGNGFFEALKDEVIIDLPESDLAMSLSVFLPEKQDAFDAGQWNQFQLLKRGGWITTNPYNTYRKNSVYMIATGGIMKLPVASKAAIVKGRVADLTPELPFEQIDHRVFRNGKAIFIPIKI